MKLSQSNVQEYGARLPAARVPAPQGHVPQAPQCRCRRAVSPSHPSAAAMGPYPPATPVPPPPSPVPGAGTGPVPLGTTAPASPSLGTAGTQSYPDRGTSDCKMYMPKGCIMLKNGAGHPGCCHTSQDTPLFSAWRLSQHPLEPARSQAVTVAWACSSRERAKHNPASSCGKGAQQRTLFLP